MSPRKSWRSPRMKSCRAFSLSLQVEYRPKQYSRSKNTVGRCGHCYIQQWADLLPVAPSIRGMGVCCPQILPPWSTWASHKMNRGWVKFVHEKLTSLCGHWTMMLASVRSISQLPFIFFWATAYISIFWQLHLDISLHVNSMSFLSTLRMYKVYSWLKFFIHAVSSKEWLLLHSSAGETLLSLKVLP